MNAPQRDPWELDDDQPMLWRTTVLARAQALRQTVDAEARWALFALQTVLEALPQMPSIVALRDILLYGPLANGAPDEVMRLLAITRRDAPPQARSTIWEDLGDLFTQAERLYAIKIDCLIISENEMGDPRHGAHLWQTIANDNVLVWSALPTN